MTTTTDTGTWPEGVVARYLTVGGAHVDVETLTTLTDNDPYGTRSTCTGCERRHEREYWVYRNYRHEPARVKASQGDARTWAQTHAETCRALPRPTDG